jgi:hypothetical protein
MDMGGGGGGVGGLNFSAHDDGKRGTRVEIWYGGFGGILGLAGAVAMHHFGMFTLHCVPVRGHITFYMSLFCYPVSLLF